MANSRIYHTCQTHYLFAELEFSDFASSGAKVDIGRIPAGSIIKGSAANLETAFASASASQPIFCVGTSETGGSMRFLGTSSIGLATAGYYESAAGKGKATTDLLVQATLSQGAMAAMPTTGKIQFFLEFIPPNDNKQLL